MSTLQDVVLKMTLHAVETAQIGREAIIGELVGTGLTPEEAQTAIDDVILVRLTPKARQAKVQQLHDAGMSQRQIAAEVGVTHTTIQRDLGTDVPAPRTADGTSVPDDEPAVAPPSGKRKEKLFPKANVTDVRKLTEGILMSLTQLGPEDVIRPAFPLMREFVQALTQWAGENWPANGETPDA